MGKNYFTEKQQEQLRNNPYIERVSEKAITYTTEFRKKFATEYEAGRLPSIILRDMGIDPQLLGKRRIDTITRRIKKFSLRAEGFEDTRKNNSGRPSTKQLSEQERIAYLEHQVKYLKQENAFLKKINFLDKQAEWVEKRKQLQKKNSDSSKK